MSVAAIEPASFLRRAGGEILAEWRSRLGAARAGNGAHAALADRMPEVLDQVAALVEEIANRESAERCLEMARAQTRTRVQNGFDVSAIVGDLSLLRASVWTIWQRHHGAPALTELQPIDLAFDAAIAASVMQYEESKQQALEAALGKLESLLAASPIGIAFLDRDLRYLRINEALAALNRRPPAAHIGRTVAEVLGEHGAGLEPILRDVLDRGVPRLNLELAVPGEGGGAADRTLLANFFPVRARSGGVLGVGGVVLDVTDRRRAEQALQQEQQRVQSIIEHCPASIWVKDAAGRIVLANHKLADALGRPYEQIIGGTSEEVLPPDAAAQHRAHDLTVASEQRAIEVEEVVPSPDGEKTFLAIKFPIPGDPPMVGGIATEITQRKQMEQELRAAVRARDTVLAVVSHDLRNPLSAIELSATALGLQLGADARARRQLDVIQRSCNRMTHLIDDLVDMASIAAGRFAVDLQVERAADVAREAVELHRGFAEGKGVTLAFTCTVDDAAIACDRERIMQVFANLVGNALKFCRAGDTIGIECAREGDDVRFTVSDTGPGIAPEQIELVFEPYWSGSSAKGGAGLGLYISRGIVERHGGRLTVESVLGAGTRFSFTVPTCR